MIKEIDNYFIDKEMNSNEDKIMFLIIVAACPNRRTVRYIIIRRRFFKLHIQCTIWSFYFRIDISILFSNVLLHVYVNLYMFLNFTNIFHRDSDRAFASHSEDRSLIPGRDRGKLLKQVPTASLPNAWQEVRVLRIFGDDHYKRM